MRSLVVFLAVGASLACVGSAQADTRVLDPTPNLPWTDPTHHGPLEVLAGTIASHIAKRDVTVRCEGDNAWVALVTGNGGNPGSELGYVAASFYLDGRLAQISPVAEVTGSVCLALQVFGSADAKPTKCAAIVQKTLTVYRTQRVKKLVHGKQVWVTERVASAVVKDVPGPPGPCYANHKQVAPMTAAFWDSYRSDALALLTLAHESIHLSGDVGGVLSNGLFAGDPLAEVHAECYGLKWISYVAQQLGDTADDGDAIAQYAYDTIYPLYKGTSYWSADCVPGGALDVRPPGRTAWP